ncbi:hypothetical protein MTR_4g028260 [Medicago truncatula]|uniref:Uncharacterized protein n=1 Tax=Medicago truncatula TaxID=3880 RepID=G7JIC2_MEDTR|nr:hypothetical protein MTR_4g028260 [Medicago truncatula]
MAFVACKTTMIPIPVSFFNRKARIPLIKTVTIYKNLAAILNIVYYGRCKDGQVQTSSLHLSAVLKPPVYFIMVAKTAVWSARNKKCFEGIDVDVATVTKAQSSIVNFKSASTTMIETLSGGPILSISDVHLTPPFRGFYKLNVDAACPMDGGSGVLGLW